MGNIRFNLRGISIGRGTCLFEEVRLIQSTGHKSAFIQEYFYCNTVILKPNLFPQKSAAS